MSDLPFTLPEQDQAIPDTSEAGSSIQHFLSYRRSTSIKMMQPDGPAPSDSLLTNMLQAAMRVPDHRKLGPWRVITFRGEARAAFGDILAERHKALFPDAKPAEVEEERSRLLRAPICVTVVSSPDHEHKTPVWEQELSSGALCLNLLYMAKAAGYAGCWISEWWAFDEEIDKALGLKPGERVAGHIFIGTANAPNFERPRPDSLSRITAWQQS